MAWNNLSVRTRLLAGFLLLACLGAIVAAIGVYNLGRMHDEESAMYERELLGLSFIKEANIALISIGRLRGSYLLETDDEQRSHYREVRAGLERALDDNLAQARPRFVTERAAQLFEQIAAQSKQYRAAQERFYALAAAGQGARGAELEQANDNVVAIGNRLADALHELSRQKEARALAQRDHGAQMFDNSRTLMVALVVLALCTSVALGLSITRSITRPLDEAVALARKVAAGDLTGKVETRSHDEIGQLMQALSEMTRALAVIVGKVRDGTETIGTASSQIAVGNLDLSARTEQQAGALQQTRSSMEELTDAVRQNAEAAGQADTLARQAAGVALKGGDAMAEVVATMTGIESAAKRIADIIGVIDGIAFQTNILALNAAVEAARAGEQGRGFAVVATEVRGLAARSAEAARQIKDLITDSVQQVDNGAQLVSDAGKTMQGVVDSIQRVSDLMSGIADASSAQSAGLEQIHQAIAHMDDMTQQNASLVEEAAAAAESLHEQADELQRSVSSFRVGTDGPAAQAVPARPAPAARGRALVRALAG